MAPARRRIATVNLHRGKLYLLAKLPPKSGEGPDRQQRIALGLDDTPVNRRVAAKRAALLQRQLDGGSFCWDDWISRSEGSRVMNWSAAAAELYRRQVVLGRSSERTWELKQQCYLKWLPMSEPVTTAAAAAMLGRYRRDQCAYQQAYYLIQGLCRVAKVDFPEVPVPSYGFKPPRSVPSDEEIVAWVEAGRALGVDWFWGMAATYGLRPHEIADAQLLEADRVLVADGTKTGSRLVIPLHREWVERFDLRRSSRPVPSEIGLAKQLHVARKKLQVPWRTYTLRHAYAGRLWRLGGAELDLFTAARLMGHSTMVHVRTYRAFVDPQTVALAAEDAIARQMAKAIGDPSAGAVP